MKKWDVRRRGSKREKERERKEKGEREREGR